MTTTHNKNNILYKDKFVKCNPLRNKIFGNKNNRITLPEIKAPKLDREINLTDSNEVQLKNNNKSAQKNNKFKNMDLRNLNDVTSSTSVFTNSTKKLFFNEKDKGTLIEKTDIFKGGLFSEATSGNNSNIIIPLVNIRKPIISRYEMFEKMKNFQNKKALSTMIEKNDNKASNKVCRKQVAKSQEVKHRIDKLLIPNFHKIKTERGINTTNLIKMLNKNVCEYVKKLNK